MLQFLHEADGVKRIYLPTNGILLSRREVAARLLPYKSKLMVLLQFDGREPDTNAALRKRIRCRYGKMYWITSRIWESACN